MAALPRDLIDISTARVGKAAIYFVDLKRPPNVRSAQWPIRRPIMPHLSGRTTSLHPGSGREGSENSIVHQPAMTRLTPEMCERCVKELSKGTPSKFLSSTWICPTWHPAARHSKVGAALPAEGPPAIEPFAHCSGARHLLVDRHASIERIGPIFQRQQNFLRCHRRALHFRQCPEAADGTATFCSAKRI